VRLQRTRMVKTNHGVIFNNRRPRQNYASSLTWRSFFPHLHAAQLEFWLRFLIGSFYLRLLWLVCDYFASNRIQQQIDCVGLILTSLELGVFLHVEGRLKRLIHTFTTPLLTPSNTLRILFG